MRALAVILVSMVAGCLAPPMGDAAPVESMYCAANRSAFDGDGRLYSLDGCYHVLVNTTQPDHHRFAIDPNATGLIVQFHMPPGALQASISLETGDKTYEDSVLWRATNDYWTHEVILSHCQLTDIVATWDAIGEVRLQILSAVSSDKQRAMDQATASCNGYWG